MDISKDVYLILSIIGTNISGTADLTDLINMKTAFALFSDDTTSTSGWVSDKIRRQFLHAPQGRFALSCWHRTAAAIILAKVVFPHPSSPSSRIVCGQTPVSYKIDERLFGFIIAIKVIQQQSFSPERISVKIILSRNVQRPLRRWLRRRSELLPDRLCTYQHHKKQKMEPSVYVSWSDLR